MATHGRGLICLCLTPERCEELGLRQMTDQNEAQFGTAFTVTIEARDGVSTGISAADRARTIQVAVDPTSTAYDLVSPGHVFPLRARNGGVLQRSGQTEAAVDLASLAGLAPAGVVCEIMNDDGTMARVPDLVEFCARHDLKLVTVADLIEYRKQTERLIERVVSVRLPTEYGDFQAVAYRETLTGKQHVALVKGDVEGRRTSSSACTRSASPATSSTRGAATAASSSSGRSRGSSRRARRAALPRAGGRGHRPPQQAARVRAAGAGPRHRRGELELGFQADAREYGIGSQILADLGLTHDPRADEQPAEDLGISGFGLTVVSQEPIEIEPNAENRGYLETKRDKLGTRSA
jgi:3,4-dihydroxy 2-butanone 4-phosphate synthase/GTP cyclohydrolase II